jgi:hypothetical protein
LTASPSTASIGAGGCLDEPETSRNRARVSSGAGLISAPMSFSCILVKLKPDVISLAKN